MKNLLSDQFNFSIILMLVVFGLIMGAVAYSILLERKISAWIQDRYGPNRVGPGGLLQPIADGLKFLLKEDIIPASVDRALFLFAPWMIFVVATIGFAVIPWGGNFRWSWMPADAPALTAQVASIDIGLLYIVAVASLGVYGVVLGGWASNNKYSFYGGMRAAAQMLSYEIPMGMAILAAILTTGCLRLEDMVTYQANHVWTVVYHPVAAFILFTTALAEANRMPFDLAESEQELVGGYHTEYSAMKLALFFLAEYAHMITSSALMVAIFFGGYLVPGWDWLNNDGSFLAMCCRMGVTAFKVFLVICVYMIVRWTLPRFRFDQLMRLAWKGLVPMTMGIVAVQGIILYAGWPQWFALPANVMILFIGAFVGAASGKQITGRQLSLPARARWGVQHG
ncbi:MAG TPA: NADH-quinone oxidoreductase subunit NuoH [Phycisphaerae bacterium]|nr:NADH-quinone oxidoreductase subunit NuoH [Phycisphaerae bacterium]